MQPLFERITLAEFLGYCRDLSIAGAVVTLGWKARGIWQHGQDFVERVRLHMDRVELTMDTLVANHLEHISKSLQQLVKTDAAQIPTDDQHR